MPHPFSRSRPTSTPDPVTDDGRHLELEFPIRPTARWGYGKPPHRQLLEVIERGRAGYGELLRVLAAHTEDLRRISIPDPGDGTQPRWHNPYFFGLDGAALYGLLADHRPARYLEVGGGYSTLFARRAITDHQLATRIISIDPAPRTEVASVCDENIRIPLEDVPLETFDQLEAGDFLFLDGSHYVFMNSDATVALLEVLPRLRAGVVVHVHDVFLPYDYRPDWTGRHYNEQYLVAAYLLGGTSLRVLLPAYFVHQDLELSSIMAPTWKAIGLTGYETAGHSFWMVRE